MDKAEVLRQRQAFYKRFKQAVRDRGWGNLTQVELGKRIGCSQPLIAKWKRYEGMPGMDRAVSLAHRLKVSLDWLMTGNAPQTVDAVLSETERKILKMWRHMTPEVKYYVFSQFALARMTPDVIAGTKLTEKELTRKIEKLQKQIDTEE